jgi:hypothetical protein
MSEQSARGRGGDAHVRGLPSERAWERSVVLEPRSSLRVPELISDGGGLPFAPSVFAQPGGGLDPTDPAVAQLLAELSHRDAPKRASRSAWRPGAAPPPSLPSPSLDDWRLLARTEDEALFGRGRPPRLHTAAFRRQGRRGTWAFMGESAARPLRATRDGIRASSWRPDPTRELNPEATTLRILLTEQAHAGGKGADGRVLAPDIHVASDEIVLTMFVTPRPGFQMRRPNPETPVRVALPCPPRPPAANRRRPL